MMAMTTMVVNSIHYGGILLRCYHLLDMEYTPPSSDIRYCYVLATQCIGRRACINSQDYVMIRIGSG